MNKISHISQKKPKATKKSSRIIESNYPEYKISGYTSVDGTVEFYSRINSLVDDSMVILNFGAGRGAWHEDDSSQYRKSLRKLKGKVKMIVGCDIDDAVFKNSTLDKKIKIKIGENLPFENASFDLIISDFTFEHIENYMEVAEELSRVLKPGGWICARTPNKYNYISILTKLIKSSWHRRLLRFVQPLRGELDVFPTKFEMNSFRRIKALFPCERFENFTYLFQPEPAYYFNNMLAFSVMKTINGLLPTFLKANLFIFLRKR